MKAIYLIVLFLPVFQCAFAQSDSVSALTTSTYKWQGTCCDNSGKSMDPTDISNQVYKVKKFYTKTPVEINIKSVVLGKNTVSLNIQYKDKIEGDTKIINLNDSVGIKLVIGKMVENDVKKYLYKLLVFKKDKANNCWRPISTFNTMYDVYSQTFSLNLFGIGYPNSNDYFEIKEGWIKLD